MRVLKLDDNNSDDDDDDDDDGDKEEEETEKDLNVGEALNLPGHLRRLLPNNNT